MSEGPSRTLMRTLAVLFSLSVAGIWFAGSHLLGPARGGPSGASALIGRAAPELGLPLVAGLGAGEGDRVTLGPSAGRVVLLDFWASWCEPCRDAIPVLNRIHDRYGERVQLFGVNVESGQDPALVRAAHRELGARFPSLQDEEGRAQLAYGVDNIPTMVLIDRSGVVRWAEAGVPDERDVAERLDRLLDGAH